MRKSDTQQMVYGPVPSRRLGRSLGVDPVPLKLCSYDCIYCQLGKSSSKTVTRRPYRKAEDILRQLEARLAQGVLPDCITIAGSGEPTLNSETGRIISGIRQATRLPVALLTNGSLLSDPRVRESIMDADIVIPSLDAHSPDLFCAINKPHRSISFDTMVDGIITFSDEYRGRLWLEIFIMEGINASESDALAFKPIVDRIDPDLVYVNTAVRPTADPSVKRVSEEDMADFYRALARDRAMDVAFGKSGRPEAGSGDLGSEIVELVSRRPVTAADLAAGLGIPQETAEKEVETLIEKGVIKRISMGSSIYFQKTHTPNKERS